MEKNNETLTESTPNARVSVEELFLDPAKFYEYFSAEIATPDIMAQIQEHTEVTANINKIFDVIDKNNSNLYDLMESEEVSSKDAIQFFDSLSKKLNDEGGKRLLLYLPFEIFPDLNWVPNNQELGESVGLLKTSAKNAWFELLSQADIRANFVDGDVIETDKRKEGPKRIVKAAHIAPALVVQGVLNKEDVLDVATKIKNYPILVQSFAGSLDIMLDLGLITEEERNAVDVEYEPVKPIEEYADISEARTRWLANRHLDDQLAFTKYEDKPLLHGKLSENLLKYNKTLVELENKINSPQLSSYIYPAAIIGGSRLKGYGVEESDFDVSVFVKPEIDGNMNFRRELEEAMGFDPDKFILTGSEDLLSIKSQSGHDPHIGDADSVHVLMGGVWIGNPDTIKMLQTNLLSKYLLDTKNRSFYLQCLEGDALRYRLLHKGFAKHYKIHSTMADLSHADEIDGKSAFYDESYRRLATRLFFERVFLPKK